MTIDYELCYRRRFAGSEEWNSAIVCDVFISVFNATERVNEVFGRVVAPAKWWLVPPQFRLPAADLPEPASSIHVFRDDEDGEAEFILKFLDDAGDLVGRIGIDITGFPRPHLLFLLAVLRQRGIKTVSCLYSEPTFYRRGPQTIFSEGEMLGVRPVAGYEAAHEASLTPNDLLIVGSGYEHQLVTRVARAKEHARKVQVLCFPPLQADFFQESVIQSAMSAESVGTAADSNPVLAPAYDPFETATVLRNLVRAESSRRPLTNLYLSPLATKPQTLGFGLFVLHEAGSIPTTIIYPFSEHLAVGTDEGLSRVWLYEVPLIVPSP